MKIFLEKYRNFEKIFLNFQLVKYFKIKWKSDEVTGIKKREK